ncbi:MAG: hypothetical protein AB7K86_18740 [Rhodospirillales bacterium]
MEFVRVGSTFRRIHPDNLVEKARVVNLADGPLGIPHVCFEVSFERANHAIVAGESRTLALRAFAERYAAAV